VLSLKARLTLSQDSLGRGGQENLLFLENEMSRGFNICLSLFAILAYAGIACLATKEMIAGKALMELSMVPACLAICYEVKAKWQRYQTKRFQPRFL
jgi:hypothetical protein